MPPRKKGGWPAVEVQPGAQKVAPWGQRPQPPATEAYSHLLSRVAFALLDFEMWGDW